MKIENFDEVVKIRDNLDKLALKACPLWHPLGFISCVIFKGQHTVTRIHYWPKNQKRPKLPDWPIHTHLFTLSSLVLHGQIKDIQYRPVRGKKYSSLMVDYLGVDSKLTPTGELCDLKITKETMVNVHGSYKVEEGVFHESEVELNNETMTIVQCKNPTKRPPIVLAPTDELNDLKDANFNYIREPYEKEIFWEKVGSFVDKFLNECSS